MTERHEDYVRIEKAIKFIEQNTHRQPSLDQIAEHINLSPFHFQKLFKRWAGVSPKRFLQYVTLEHAKQIIKESTILDTTLDMGLSSPSRLHDLFVSVEAVTPGEYKTEGLNLQINYSFQETPFGTCLIGVTERGICHLTFTQEEDCETEMSRLRTRWENAEFISDKEIGKKVVEQVFNSSDRDVKILLKGTNFQLKVWQALLRIPSGNLATYKAIAETIGAPTSSRAVGNAIGLNPIGIIIPCHRVLRTNGEIGGYMWGTARKRAIIGKEMSQ